MGNIIGNPFRQFVKKQIQQRQKILGKNTLSPTDLSQMVTKTPFIRMGSSVDLTFIDDRESVSQKLQSIGIPKEYTYGNTLSKNFILQSGVVSSDTKLKYGLTNYDETKVNGWRDFFNGSYGFGEKGIHNRGFTPMSGITNLSTNYYNNGSLSQTTINIRCFDRLSFQIIDTLYMRVGYSVMIEFGWSQYVDNDGNLKTFDEFHTTPLQMFLNGDINQYDLENEIQNEIEYHSGNYQCIVGVINNFSWNILDDGSYDITLKIIGKGSVIESLTIDNLNQSYKVGWNTQQRDTSQYRLPTDDEIDDFYVNNQSSLGGRSGDLDDITYTKNMGEILKRELESMENSLNIDDLLQSLHSKYGESNNTPYTPSYRGGITDFVLKNFRYEGGKINDLIFPNSIFYHSVDFSGETPTNESKGNRQTYMKYGLLLALIQSRLFLYDKQSDTPNFVFDIDFVGEEKKLYMGSMDNTSKSTIDTIFQSNLFRFSNLTNDDNYMLTIPSQMKS